MSKLLYKEFRLCMQPLVLIFFLFVLMLLIPSYPYTIMGFFICNGLFYSFTQSIADNDTLFTLLLPVSKKDAVRGKLWFMLLVQLALVVLCVISIAAAPFSFAIFTRFATLVLFLVPPLVMELLEDEAFLAKSRFVTLTKLEIVVCLLLACARGNLSGYKFFLLK